MHSSIQSIYAMWKCYNMCESVQTIYLKNFSTQLTKSHMCVRRKEHGCIDCTALHAHNDHNGTYENMHSVFYKYKLKQGKSRAPWSLVNEMMPPWLRKVQLPLKNLSLSNNALEKKWKEHPLQTSSSTSTKDFQKVNQVNRPCHRQCPGGYSSHQTSAAPQLHANSWETAWIWGVRAKVQAKTWPIGWPPFVSNAYWTCFEKKRGWPKPFSTQGLPSSTWTCSVFLWACIDCHVPDQFEER